MGIVAKANKSEFTAAPEGLWPAVCVDVVDLGMVTTQWGESHQIQIRWQLEDIDPKSGKPYMISQKYRLSLHEKSKLRPHLESWRGKKFTQEELDGFDLEKLLGANCQIQVIHNIVTNGNTYANVQAIVPPARGAAKLAARDYTRVTERTEGHGGEAPVDEDFTPF